VGISALDDRSLYDIGYRRTEPSVQALAPRRGCGRLTGLQPTTFQAKTQKRPA
jgi:hypothetical protein